ncbi:hypothetical protein chiPu_0008701 [Chiloscyllium punctatum]|uniref:lysoplasmalogenase n=1 Tax=Chiloscyllium punctatum TaxID=137246 RepID=A0A401SIT2_CHIPU|nr:hypothetical protein [Chiloscyllium punctatum]
MMKSIGPKLIPFLKTFCIYFVLWLPTSNPSWFSALIKCLPVLSLGFFVLAHSISQGVYRPYAKKVLVALLFSALGDVFLTWGDQGFFIHEPLKTSTLGTTHLDKKPQLWTGITAHREREVAMVSLSYPLSIILACAMAAMADSDLPSLRWVIDFHCIIIPWGADPDLDQDFGSF